MSLAPQLLPEGFILASLPAAFCDVLKGLMSIEFRDTNLTSRPLRSAVLSFVRAVRPRGWVLGLAGDGEPPATADRQKADPEAERRTDDHRCGERELEQIGDHHHRSASQRGDRVKVGPQDRGNFGQRGCRASCRRRRRSASRAAPP